MIVAMKDRVTVGDVDVVTVYFDEGEAVTIDSDGTMTMQVGSHKLSGNIQEWHNALLFGDAFRPKGHLTAAQRKAR